MATPTPVDQTVQRDQTPPPPDQADLPGSPNDKDLAEEAKANKVAQDFTPSSGPDPPEVTAEFSALSLSLTSSSSSSTSPQASSTEDSPQEASYSSSDYDSDSSDEDLVTSNRAEVRTMSLAEE